MSEDRERLFSKLGVPTGTQDPTCPYGNSFILLGIDETLPDGAVAAQVEAAHRKRVALVNQYGHIARSEASRIQKEATKGKKVLSNSASITQHRQQILAERLEAMKKEGEVLRTSETGEKAARKVLTLKAPDYGFPRGQVRAAVDATVRACGQWPARRVAPSPPPVPKPLNRGIRALSAGKPPVWVWLACVTVLAVTHTAPLLAASLSWAFVLLGFVLALRLRNPWYILWSGMCYACSCLPVGQPVPTDAETALEGGRAAPTPLRLCDLLRRAESTLTSAQETRDLALFDRAVDDLNVVIMNPDAREKEIAYALRQKGGALMQSGEVCLHRAELCGDSASEQSKHERSLAEARDRLRGARRVFIRLESEFAHVEAGADAAEMRGRASLLLVRAFPD